MKKLIFFLFFVNLSTYASESLIVSAVSKTPYGKNAKKNLSREVKKIIPSWAFAGATFALNPRFQYKVNKNHRIDVNLKRQVIKYQIVYDF